MDRVNQMDIARTTRDQISSRAQPHKTSRQEIDGLRTAVNRDLKDTAAAGLSHDRRFATACQPV